VLKNLQKEQINAVIIIDRMTSVDLKATFGRVNEELL